MQIARAYQPNIKLNFTKSEPIRSGKIEDLSPWQRVSCLPVKDCDHMTAKGPVQGDELQSRGFWKGGGHKFRGFCWVGRQWIKFFEPGDKRPCTWTFRIRSNKVDNIYQLFLNKYIIIFQDCNITFNTNFKDGNVFFKFVKYDLEFSLQN